MIERIYKISFASIYPLYVKKVERKGRTQAELDQVIIWLTNYTLNDVKRLAESEITFDDFFKQAPLMNPNRHLITGMICGVRIETIEEPLMREIRYLDKLVDELAKGKAMSKILREAKT